MVKRIVTECLAPCMLEHKVSLAWQNHTVQLCHSSQRV